jgi:inner membrane protein
MSASLRAIGLLCMNLWLTSNGDLLMQTSQTLGLKEGAVRTYNEQAANHQLYAQVTGVWVSDRSRADGRYPIVASEGTDFVVKTPKGLAKTGTQIVTTKVAVEIGEMAQKREEAINTPRRISWRRLSLWVGR